MGFWLLLPFFLVRFGLLALLGGGAIRRAAHFPPLLKGEKVAHWLYQLSTVAILVTLCFLKIQYLPRALFYAGVAVYGVGTVLLLLSVIHFAAPSASGVNQNGLYRFSRNPMYLAYFVYFIGCVLLTQSLLLLGFVLVFQITAHWMIRAEERWCLQTFGQAYRQYMEQVRRYL